MINRDRTFIPEDPRSHDPREHLSRRDFLSLSGAALASCVLPSGTHSQIRSASNSGELTALTIRQASELMRKKAVSSAELTLACLQRIDKYEPVLNAFITITREKALAQARTMDEEIRRGKLRGPLHGIPIALKDNIDTAGVRTTAASVILADRIPNEDAEVVRRLKAAGAVILGKLNMDEFASGSSSSSSYFKPVHNPWALDRAPSGSSGGSAVAVAAEMCFGTLGTDTRGSIRGPAGVCGIVGMKPTNGRVSNRGVIPFIWTLDTVGPMCRTVEDTAILLQVIAGYDPEDPLSVNKSVPDYPDGIRSPVAKFRIGTPCAPFFDEGDAEMARIVRDAISVLERLSAGTRDVELPSVGGVSQMLDAEVYAYHSQWFPKLASSYQPSMRRSLERSATISAADYATARHEVDRLRREVVKAFEQVDLLVTPARKSYPGKIADILKAATEPPPVRPVLEIANTHQFSVFGLPAMNVPCGFTSAGLPVAIQIIGPHWEEERVFALGHAFEQATQWHKRRPPLAP